MGAIMKAFSNLPLYTLIGDAYKALDNPGIQLFVNYNFTDAFRIYSYAHNEGGTQLFNGQNVLFDKTKTLIQVLNTRTDIKAKFYDH